MYLVFHVRLLIARVYAHLNYANHAVLDESVRSLGAIGFMVQTLKDRSDPPKDTLQEFWDKFSAGEFDLFSFRDF